MISLTIEAIKNKIEELESNKRMTDNTIKTIKERKEINIGDGYSVSLYLQSFEEGYEFILNSLTALSNQYEKSIDYNKELLCGLLEDYIAK